MASYLAIEAVSRILCNVLEEVLKPLFPVADFAVFRPADLIKETPLNEGISILLYQVGANLNRRNLPPRRNILGNRYKPSLPVDLYYMITPWGSTAEQQQRILGRAMRVLDDLPILPASFLNKYIPEGNVFQDNESVELIFNPLSLQEMAALWENLNQTKALLSVTYVMRMILLDSDLEMTEGSEVQTRVFDMAKVLE